MNVYVSADIEGIVGSTAWSQATPGTPEYPALAERMTRMVSAACAGAFLAGASEVRVRDAHGPGRNLRPEDLPTGRDADTQATIQVRKSHRQIPLDAAPRLTLCRGWSGHPLSMVEGIDEGFDALMLIGYHARAGSGGNPLSHTHSASQVMEMRLDGRPVSEMHLYALAAALFEVPVVLVSGDEAVCEAAKALIPQVETVPVLRGVGSATVSVHPFDAARQIREAADRALMAGPARCRIPAPGHTRLEVRYKEPARAYGAGFYPGARLVDDTTVAFEADDYFEILRALAFLV